MDEVKVEGKGAFCEDGFLVNLISSCLKDEWEVGGREIGGIRGLKFKSDNEVVVILVGEGHNDDEGEEVP